MAKQAQTASVTLNGAVYPVRYDYGSLVAFCDEIGASIDNLQEALGGLDMSKVNLIVWAGVMSWTYAGDDDPGSPSLTPATVNRWLRALSIDEAQAVLAVCMDAFNAAMPRAKIGKD